jgi:retinol dehydrogenase-13
MKDKIILITGGTDGIGKEVVRELALMGARIIFTARNEEKANFVQKEIFDFTNNKPDFIICDLANFSSVKKAVEIFSARYQNLDVLINNAGVFEQEKVISQNGLEMNMVVNFYSPVLLTYLLLPLLKKGGSSRIINVSSSMHKEGVIDFGNLNSEKLFDRYQSYGQSKLALILFTKYLAEELKGDHITVNALHPGVVDTKLANKPLQRTNPLLRFIFRKKMITPNDGARTIVYLAVSDEVKNISGKYFVNKKIEDPVIPKEADEITQKLMTVAKNTVGL